MYLRDEEEGRVQIGFVFAGFYDVGVGDGEHEIEAGGVVLCGCQFGKELGDGQGESVLGWSDGAGQQECHEGQQLFHFRREGLESYEFGGIGTSRNFDHGNFSFE